MNKLQHRFQVWFEEYKQIAYGALSSVVITWVVWKLAPQIDAEGIEAFVVVAFVVAVLLIITIVLMQPKPKR